MKQLDAILKSAATKELAINLSVAIVVPIVVNALAPMVRPVTRSVLKTGIIVFEKARESVSEFGELVEDIVAEVQDELQQAREQSAGLADPGQASRDGTDKSA